MKFLLSLAALAVATASFAQSFTSTGGPYVIPDNSATGVTATVNVTGSVGALQSVSFTSLAHTWIGDLTMTLTDGSSNSVILLQRPNVTATNTVGDGGNLLAANTYTFVPGGTSIWGFTATATNIPSGNYATAANVAGVQTATNFSGVGGSGVWSLFVTDSAVTDTGGFSSVTLNFAPVPEPATLAALGIGAVALLRRRKKA